MDASELWISSEEDEDGLEEYATTGNNAASFTLELLPKSESGGEHACFSPRVRYQQCWLIN